MGPMPLALGADMQGPEAWLLLLLLLASLAGRPPGAHRTLASGPPVPPHPMRLD